MPWQAPEDYRAPVGRVKGKGSTEQVGPPAHLAREGEEGPQSLLGGTADGDGGWREDRKPVTCQAGDPAGCSAGGEAGEVGGSSQGTGP